ncbi:hypothetical protein [Helicobacter trogontum]
MESFVQNKFLILSLFIFIHCMQAVPLLPFVQAKADISEDKVGWEVDLNRIALNFTQSSLTNQSLYTSFSDSNLKGSSQLGLQFFFTLNGNFYAPRFVVFNTAYAEYGFTQITRTDQSVVINKSLDKMLFSTDYTQRMWDFDWGFEVFEMGPYMRVSYQTEFNPTPSVGRRHIINYMVGAKLFDGRYIKNLYFDFFGEHDLNPMTRLNGTGLEVGISLEYSLNKHVKWTYTMNYKKYMFNAEDSKISPDYQLFLETRIDAKLFRSLSVAPLLRYYMLKADNIELPASNFMVGVSLNFGKVLLPPRQVLKDYEFVY